MRVNETSGVREPANPKYSQGNRRSYVNTGVFDARNVKFGVYQNCTWCAFYVIPRRCDSVSYGISSLVSSSVLSPYKKHPLRYNFLRLYYPETTAVASSPSVVTGARGRRSGH